MCIDVLCWRLNNLCPSYFRIKNTDVPVFLIPRTVHIVERKPDQGSDSMIAVAFSNQVYGFNEVIAIFAVMWIQSEELFVVDEHWKKLNLELVESKEFDFTRFASSGIIFKLFSRLKKRHQVRRQVQIGHSRTPH